jgi:cyclopropane fatty-acyl-phospholipid synthase-like methyltransferase
VSVFDEKAATWDDDPTKVERARIVAQAIQEVVPASPTTRLLEYGAGTGLLSEELVGHVGSITLVDPSTGMREVMAAKVESGRLPGDSRIWDLDLAVDPAPEDRFDLVTSLMTLHHVSDVPRVLKAFSEMLADGGRLALVDLVEEDGSFHDEGFAGHNGFDTAQLAQDVRASGLSDVAVRENLHHVEKEGRHYPLFLLTATKRD